MTYQLTITRKGNGELVTETAETPADIVAAALRHLIAHSPYGRLITEITDGSELRWFASWDLSNLTLSDIEAEIADNARSLIAELHWHADHAEQFAALVHGSSENSST